MSTVDETSSLLGPHLHRHASAPKAKQLHEDVPFYARPRQRQRWDDTQVLPHVNWGDLYWDLFYVSGAFNLAAALKESLTFVGVSYFVACYLSIVSTWTEKTSYDARYAPDDNLFHRSFEVLHILALGVVVQHIRSVQVMQNIQDNATTFTFCAALTVESFLALLRHIDVRDNVEGGPEARHNAIADVRRKTLCVGLFGTAAAVAAFGYLTSPTPASTSDQETAESLANNQNQVPWTNHIPIILCFLAYFSGNLMIVVDVLCLTSKRPGTHKDYNVPLNIEFMLHRTGEWVMLMLGESVLALLIVEQSEGHRYYATFFAGVLSVTLFQYLYFRSQPFEADDHAMRRSTSGGLTFAYAMTAYFASLVLVGCAYKMILHYYLEEQELAEEHGSAALTDDHAVCNSLARMRRDIACLFGWSMALSFFTLDIMNISHRGWTANLRRFCVNGRWAWTPLFITAVDYGLLVLTVLVTGWIDRLEWLAVAGLTIVVAQVLLRTRGLRYFPVSKMAMEMAKCGGDVSLLPDEYRRQFEDAASASPLPTERRWPNRTEPRSIPADKTVDM